MGYAIEFHPRAAKELSAQDPQHREHIVRFLRGRIAPLKDPRAVGGALRGPLGDLWKYRVGDFRIICEIRDEILVVLVVRVGNRRDVYRR